MNFPLPPRLPLNLCIYLLIKRLIDEEEEEEFRDPPLSSRHSVGSPKAGGIHRRGIQSEIGLGLAVELDLNRCSLDLLNALMKHPILGFFESPAFQDDIAVSHQGEAHSQFPANLSGLHQEFDEGHVHIF